MDMNINIPISISIGKYIIFRSIDVNIIMYIVYMYLILHQISWMW